jgi:glycosyltransferase involved in cell wall biosynthesis
MPLLSVIIPTFNSGRYLAETLASVRALEGIEPEIIVVDDGSTDETPARAEAMPGVKVWRQANAGDAAARKRGLRMSSGEFVIFLDHDDLLHPDAAQVHLAEITADPTLAMVFGSNLIIDSEGRVIGENLAERRRFSGRSVVRHTTPSFSQCLYRRSALDRIGDFRAEARSCADIDLNLRLLGWQDAGLCHGHMVMSYRYHPGQQTRSPARLSEQMMEVFENLLGPGKELEDAELLAFARRYWARYYGQFLPSEMVRAAVAGDGRRLVRALRVFGRTMPHSLFGATRFAARKLVGRA